MPSRRSFIAASAVAAAAGLAGMADTSTEVDAAAPKGPSSLALAQARWLRQAMPKAKLSDELVEKIAGDIDGYAPVAAEFRKATLRNWDEPDFVFTAGPEAKRR
ncbi:MAG TPA: twin-arginine translocation signal domain-containing protein [Candidatus Eremiobacteraceae bacterium]|nr:twin-arginine translocation signal domain-containing protein [Candidatus Eremiobacteraceae bacterium]